MEGPHVEGDVVEDKHGDFWRHNGFTRRGDISWVRHEGALPPLSRPQVSLPRPQAPRVEVSRPQAPRTQAPLLEVDSAFVERDLRCYADQWRNL